MIFIIDYLPRVTSIGLIMNQFKGQLCIADALSRQDIV